MTGKPAGWTLVSVLVTLVPAGTFAPLAGKLIEVGYGTLVGTATAYEPPAAAGKAAVVETGANAACDGRATGVAVGTAVGAVVGAVVGGVRPRRRSCRRHRRSRRRLPQRRARTRPGRSAKRSLAR